MTESTLPAAEPWADFHRVPRSRPPRELLRRVLGCFEIESRPPGVAVDLGCGSGADALELLRRGWVVHAVDVDSGALERLSAAVPPDVRGRLRLHAERMEDFALPPADLIWSSWSLPYCPADAWPTLWTRMIAALNVGGRLAADLFGPSHAWAGEDGIFTIGEEALRALLCDLTVEAFDIEDGVRPAGDGRITRWHAFGVAVRKPAAATG